MVDVSSQNSSISINVSSSGNSASINATPDMAMFYSEKSREWAISNRIVDGVDYSSKYYAQQSNVNAQKVVQSENNVKEIYNSLLEESNSISNEIREVGNETISSIEATKTTILSDIEFVADGEKQEIQGLVDDEKEEIKDLIGTGKDELKEAIGDVKVLTTLKIGQIGIAPLGIDETLNMERYLNGQIIIQDQFKGFTNYLKRRVELYPSVACTEEEWQTEVTMSAFSQCGKFVIDDNAGTIRLPKVVNIQGLTDLSKLGEIVEAGLPNIEGSFTSPKQVNASFNLTNTTGAFVDLGSNGVDGSVRGTTDTATAAAVCGFDASLSNPIYKDGSTVQQEQIQYPYFIQVATGAETEDNIINEIELNNPFSLLDYKYSEYELNNLSWLRSQGQYNSKAIYPAVYDLLLKIYNGTETKAGVSVKLSTEEYTDYDFVLNTAEETFRLPIKVKLASGKAVVGNGMTLGLMNDTQLGGLYTTSNEANLRVSTAGYGLPSGDNIPTGTVLTAGKCIGVTTDPTKSGIETSDSDLYLYFYVGETVQNVNLINAGRIEEKIASLIPDNSSLIAGYGIPSDRYIDLTLGASGTEYTAPATGWVSLVKNTGSSQTNGNIIVAVGACEWRTFCTLQGTSAQINVPVAKGQSFKITYNLSGTTGRFRFVYAQGEK